MDQVKTENQLALEKINKALYAHTGYYTWVALREGKPWYVRIPTPEYKGAIYEGDEDKKIQYEQIELVHFCDPTAFVSAIENQEKDKLAEFSGYVHDGICDRCKTEMKDLDKA